MIYNIIQLIFTILVLVIAIKLFNKGYKEAVNDFEKILYEMLSFAAIFPIVIYYLDRYDIPSFLGYTTNINSSNWIGILIDYSAVIFSTLLNATFLIYVTLKQIEQTNKDNIKLNNETQRMQNIPLLRYQFTHENVGEEILGEGKKWIFSNRKKDYNEYIDFTIEIENIGLNSVRKVFLELKSEIFNKKQGFELCNQSNIEIKEKKKKEIIITNVPKGEYKFEITVYYQDLLKNWYKQIIELKVAVTDIYNPNNKGFDNITYVKINDEKIVSTLPSFIKNN